MLLGVTVLLAGACTAPAPKPDFDAAQPVARLYAIERAGAQRDPAATRSLIEQLDSDDAAVRMMAYEALKRLDGDGYGYDPTDPPAERRAASKRWAASVSSGTAAGGPAPGTTSTDDG